jgi:hypothetical protein
MYKIGVQEIATGTWSADDNGSIVIKVVAKEFSRTTTARPPHVTKVERVFTFTPASFVASTSITEAPRVVPPSFSYTMGMATTNTPAMTHHLRAVLFDS